MLALIFLAVKTNYVNEAGLKVGGDENNSIIASISTACIERKITSYPVAAPLFNMQYS